MNFKKLTRRNFVQQVTVAGIASVITPNYLWEEAKLSGAGDIRNVMDKAAKCCLAWLNPEKHFLPTGGYEIAHDTGRWWDAMLRYEACTGVRIPGKIEKVMMQNLYSLTDNPAALLTTKGKCNPHNLRETMLTYTALLKFRKDEQAKEKGSKLVNVIYNLLEEDGQLNYDRLSKIVREPITSRSMMANWVPQGQWFNSTASTGRAIEPIICFYEETGDKSALDLARRLSEVHLRNIIDPAGEVRSELLDTNHIGHTHSYLGTLRGLLLYGLISGEKHYIKVVEKTYRKGIWGTSISYSGWTPHDQGKIRYPNKDGDPKGEHASCGDVAQLALWLALSDNQPDLLDDVERLLKARLFPSQIDSPSEPRKNGAWGVYSHPFGYGAILDVFAAVLHSLTDIYNHIVTKKENKPLCVNLHFDIDTPDVTVRSKRGKDAELSITLKKYDGPLLIRVPEWASRDSVGLSVGRQYLPLHWQEPSWLLVKEKFVNAGNTLVLRHDLPEKQTIEEMPVSHDKYYLKWCGDEVASCIPKVEIYN